LKRYTASEVRKSGIKGCGQLTRCPCRVRRSADGGDHRRASRPGASDGSNVACIDSRDRDHRDGAELAAGRCQRRQAQRLHGEWLGEAPEDRSQTDKVGSRCDCLARFGQGADRDPQQPALAQSPARLGWRQILRPDVSAIRIAAQSEIDPVVDDEQCSWQCTADGTSKSQGVSHRRPLQPKLNCRRATFDQCSRPIEWIVKTDFSVIHDPVEPVKLRQARGKHLLHEEG
jgi:hypothetical protein